MRMGDGRRDGDRDGRWQPFRVVATLATPLCLNHPWLHFDGLIAHLIYLRVRGRDYYTLPTKRVVHLAADEMGPYCRTLRVTNDGMDGLTHASVSWFDPPDPAYRSLQYFKRFEERGWPRRNKVPLGSGHYRTWLLRWVYLPVHTVTFYGCGDIALVRDLLADLTHLGNDHRVGWGRIAALTVEPLAEDRSVVWQGRAMRPIPVRLLRSWSDAVPLAWRPPYWAVENVALCAPPGAEVELRDRDPQSA